MKLIENKYWDKKCDCTTCDKPLVINGGEKFVRINAATQAVNICQVCFNKIKELYERVLLDKA